MTSEERWLSWAACITAAMAVLHLAIIVGGPRWYRFFGAGEQMARLAARGSPYPTIVTLGIAGTLGVWLTGVGRRRRSDRSRAGAGHHATRPGAAVPRGVLRSDEPESARP